MRAARAYICLFLALTFLIVGRVTQAQNPFTQREVRSAPQMYGMSTPAFIRHWSRELQASIADLSWRVRSGQWSAGVAAFFIAVLFGVIHIAGPGHGKVFALSYFAGRTARAREGLLYSAIVNAVDSLSALALVLLGYVVLRAILPAFSTEGPRYLQLVAYGLIVVFGTYHLLRHLQGHAKRKKLDAGHDHRNLRSDSTRSRAESSWLLALSVGLVPCPVSTILLVYGIANGVLSFMVLMVVGVSVGGFLTMSGIAFAVIAGRERLLAGLKRGMAAKLAVVLEYAASSVIIVSGGVLFLSLL